MATMCKFIELTQPINMTTGIKERKIMVNVSRLDFYYNKHIFLGEREIDVLESLEEINNLIEK